MFRTVHRASIGDLLTEKLSLLFTEKAGKAWPNAETEFCDDKVGRMTRKIPVSPNVPGFAVVEINRIRGQKIMTTQRWTIRRVQPEVIETIRELSHTTGKSAGQLVTEAILNWVRNPPETR